MQRSLVTVSHSHKNKVPFHRLISLCLVLDKMATAPKEKQKSDKKGMAGSFTPEWTISSPRIFQLLSSAKSVLVAGCGGGYDVTSGLPLFFALKGQGKEVVLANLTFTDIESKLQKRDKKSRFCDMCVKVTHDMNPVMPVSKYFPEYYLTKWLWQKFKESIPVYTFVRETGVSQMAKAYTKICSEHNVDAIVLVDGGTDSLMFGTEEKMGTPVEDQTSIMAVHLVKSVALKILAAVGFGVDHFHGVSHGLFLENVATLEREGGYLGCFSIPRQSVEGELYLEGYRDISSQMQSSIVCASITDGMLGHFGNHHSTSRTGSSKLFINPLMPVYWTFLLETLVSQIPYSEDLCKTKNAGEVMHVIFAYQDSLGKLRKRIPLPM